MSSSEAHLIGQMLQDPQTMSSCDLSPDEFTSSQYAQIYRKMVEFYDARQAIDPFSIADALESETARDWTAVCVKLANESRKLGDFAGYVELIRKTGRLRRISDTLSIAMDQLQRDKNPDIANQVIEQLMALRTSRKKAIHTIDEVMTSVLDRMDRAHKSGEFVGVKSGITDVDHVLGGFHNSDLVVIAARPAVGKTAMALNFANSAANSKWVAVFSCEQGHEQIGSRLVSIEGAINSLQVRNVDFEDHEWAFLENAVELVRKKKIIIVDRPYPKIAEIISTARQLKYEHDIKAIYVDYLQIIESSRTDIPKHEQTGQVVRALKALALELDIPVVVLAQVRREVDSRTDKRPMQGDISDSSEIEKTADVIMTLYRDEAYDPKSNHKGVAEIVVCKNRHGPTGVVHCAFIGKFMQFKDLAHTSYLNSDQ